MRVRGVEVGPQQEKEENVADEAVAKRNIVELPSPQVAIAQLVNVHKVAEGDEEHHGHDGQLAPQPDCNRRPSSVALSNTLNTKCTLGADAVANKSGRVHVETLVSVVKRHLRIALGRILLLPRSSVTPLANLSPR